jgi:acyl carrier protein
MSISPTVDLDTIVDAIIAILVEVIGDEFLLDVEVTMETTFSHDLELESIEFVAMAEKLQERYAGVDFTAFLAGLEIDEILALSVGQLAGHVARSLDSSRRLEGRPLDSSRRLEGRPLDSTRRLEGRLGEA